MTVYVKDLIKYSELSLRSFKKVPELVEKSYGFYDWFCKTSELPKKAYDYAKKIKTLVEKGFINPETTLVFFKNNCPLSRELYDDMRFYVVPEDKKDLIPQIIAEFTGKDSINLELTKALREQAQAQYLFLIDLNYKGDVCCHLHYRDVDDIHKSFTEEYFDDWEDLVYSLDTTNKYSLPSLSEIKKTITL